MIKKLPILEKFYDESAYLTTEKAMKGRPKFQDIFNYLENHKVNTCVIVFNRNLKEFLSSHFDNVVEFFGLQAGEDKHNIYFVDNIAFVCPFVGSPNAAASMEELACFGFKNFIATGSAGLIVDNFDVRNMLVVEDAIRDEGASYHYASPEVEAVTDSKITEAIKTCLTNRGIGFKTGRTWTTDAFYRETKSLIDLRIKQGCTAVEMECATWCVVAKKLGLNFGQFLFFSDKVMDKEWSQEGDTEHRLNIKNQITLLCYEIAKEVDKIFNK